MEKKSIYKFLASNRKLFPFLAAFTLLALFAESYMYAGFLRQFILVDSLTLLVLSFCSASLVYIDMQMKPGKIFFPEAFGLRLNLFLFPLIFVSYLAMQFLEARNYVNFVFTGIHIQPANFFYLMVFSGGLIILSFLPRKATFDPTRNLKGGLLFFVIMALLVYYFLENVSLSVESAIISNVHILTHLGASYDDKMRVEWKFYYDYMKFVNGYAEGSSAVIATPPTEEPWPAEGNSDLSRYFVYPKRLIKGSRDGLPESDFDYVMIARGTGITPTPDGYGWPKVYVPAERIWYLNPETLEVTVVESDFDPRDVQDRGAWGLIKVDRKRI